jgi:hypothetical protein
VSTIVVDHFSLFLGHADKLASTASLHRHSQTAPSQPVTYVRTLRRRFPSSVLRHLRPPSPVSLPSIRPHVCVSLGFGMAVGNTFPGSSPSAGRNRPVKCRCSRGSPTPLFWPRSERSSGPGHFELAGPCSTVGQAQVHSAILYFPFELIHFKFKSSLNFGNS